jgi:hypothetical protein
MKEIIGGEHKTFNGKEQGESKALPVVRSPLFLFGRLTLDDST